MKNSIYHSVKDYIVNSGKVGAEECERYIELPTPIRTVTNLTIHQVCHFSDTDEVIAYCLDKDNNGYWREWDLLSERAKKSIHNQLFTK